MDVRETIRAWLQGALGGRRFIIACPVIQECGWLAREVTDLGAAGCFLLAGRAGAGDVPAPDLGPQRVLGLPPGDLMASIRDAERAFRALPDHVVAEIDRFDPAREALALGAFFGNGLPVAGRRMFGGRPTAWQALEDKVVIDEVWDAAGVPRARREVVPVAEAAAAAERIDEGDGTVWAGDQREGFHGGASHTFRVQDDAGRRRARAFLGAHADRVRVMPFLEGVPCSIHGLVLPETVLAFRPAEMVVLRREGGSGFHYMRAATAWDPPPADREAMRAIARRVGAHLREAVGYRGAFTVDGVMTRDGFRPTELNPRVGAAMGMVVRDLPLTLLHYALIEGATFPMDPAAFEADRVADADASRVGRLGFTFEGEVGGSRHFALSRGPDGALRAHDGDDGADVLGVVGPGPAGVFVNFVLKPSVLEVGRSVGPLAAELVAYCDARLGSRIGPVTPARDVRPSP